MVKLKTSVYVDEELWRRLKEHAARRGMGVGPLLEELIEDGTYEAALDEILLELAGSQAYEVDFEPIEPKEGPVSELIKAMRDERGNRVFG
ncbi:TPA: ribbon-helix-helix protein, CopG family [Candidatus Bathyarchaeota archaeon]|nr:ribbon-helix-helix protein, CopG family [Candidatus Bathyarchaeota archaeon]